MSRSRDRRSPSPLSFLRRRHQSDIQRLSRDQDTGGRQKRRKKHAADTAGKQTDDTGIQETDDRRTQKDTMSAIRRMSPTDLFSLNLTNLDPLTENYDLGFYLNYLMRWPSLFSVVQDRDEGTVGYSASIAPTIHSPHHAYWKEKN